MAARMGIKEGNYSPIEGLSFEEAEAILNSGIYPYKPVMSQEDWGLLKSYILSLAPDSISSIPQAHSASKLKLFDPKPVQLDEAPGTVITYLKFKENLIWVGDLMGNLSTYFYPKNETELFHEFTSTVIDNTLDGEEHIVTLIGKLDPTDLSSGRIYKKQDDRVSVLPEFFHRPVYNLVQDLNNDGQPEMVLCEFGNLTGKLSLLVGDGITFEKKILLNQPGTIKVAAEDMNGDQKLDLIVLTSQGDESITILYQNDDLRFTPEKVLRFSPIFGTSWFELVDYDGDGDLDIVTVHGDNADKTYIHKPYHGLRVHFNEGKNQFTEKYFYPLNGATRLTAEDFDRDGDIDFGIISTFPDYDKYPNYGFVYLENLNSEKFEFEPQIFDQSKDGRWLLCDQGDVDNDGDIDIILSSFSYVFNPVPKEIKDNWMQKNADLMILENQSILQEKQK